MNACFLCCHLLFFHFDGKVKYQALDTVLNHKIKHQVVRQKYSAVSHLFNSLLSNRISV